MTTEAKTGETAASGTGEFGTSETGGKRMDYVNSQWKDPFFAGLCYAHLLLMIVLAILLNVGGKSETTTTTAAVTITYTGGGTSSGSNSSKVNEIIGKIAAALLVPIAIGMIWGVVWLKICERYPQNVIKFSFYLLISFGVVLILIGVIEDVIGLTICGVILTLLYTLYAYCSWSRIPFSAVLLSLAASITTTYQGTIVISLLTCIFVLLWEVIWACVVVGGLTGGTVTGGSFFLLLISYYWGVNIIMYVSHTTTCGVAAVWYFSKELVRNPTRPAMHRSMTTSFGSICFGALLVAILQAMKQMLKSFRGTACYIVVYCILLCIEALIRFFNKYAFCEVAIYGMCFIEAGKAVFALFNAKGFALIINDIVAGVVGFAGGFCCFVISVLVALAIFADEMNSKGSLGVFGPVVAIICMIYGGLVGWYVTSLVLAPLDSAISCLFVCFAEDPKALENNHNEHYTSLVNAENEAMKRYLTTGYAGVPDQQQQQAR